MAQYEADRWYRFKDSNGKEYTFRGDDPILKQASAMGVMPSVTPEGKIYVAPYAEINNGKLTAHLPDWFKESQSYQQWTTYAGQLKNATKEQMEKAPDILKRIGEQATVDRSLDVDAASYGITDADAIQKYKDNWYALGAAGKGEDALVSIWGNEEMSIKDIIKQYNDLSKEDLSASLTGLLKNLEDAANNKYAGSQKDLADTAFLVGALKYVNDNYRDYGDEFKGLLEASTMQKIQRTIAQAYGNLSESNAISRLLVQGVGSGLSLLSGKGLDFDYEKAVDEFMLEDPIAGANLEGLTGAEVAGTWAGTIANIAATIGTVQVTGYYLNGKFADVVTLGQKGIIGSIASDFFINDLPLDIMMLVSDTVRTGSFTKALWDPEEPQSILGIPGFRYEKQANAVLPSGFGPEVAGGFIMNVVGDLARDIAPAVISTTMKTAYKGLDEVTNGGVSRTRERASLQGLKIREGLHKVPVLGKAWEKFIGLMMTPQDAATIRKASQQAIAEGSMDPYIRAQNYLTLRNHAAMEIVGPRVDKIRNELGIGEMQKKFLKNAKEYGGVGETKKGALDLDVVGKEIEKYKIVDDVMPRQIKQGVIDADALSQLKGEAELEGGIISNPERTKQIAELQARVDALPDDVKEYIEKWSEFNKRVEGIGVELGITDEEWFNAMMEDPRWAQYSVRQAITINGKAPSGGAADRIDPAILNKARKGYMSEYYIDPVLSLNLKIEALGRAYAYNEIAKMAVNFEVSGGRVIAGSGGVSAAQKLSTVESAIKGTEELRTKIDYDNITGSATKEFGNVGASFTKLNDLLRG